MTLQEEYVKLLNGRTEKEFVADVKKNWTVTERWRLPKSMTVYSHWLSPDARFLVGIHEADDELFKIQDLETWEMGVPLRDKLRLQVVQGLINMKKLGVTSSFDGVV